MCGGSALVARAGGLPEAPAAGPAGAQARSPVGAGASQYHLFFARDLPSCPLQATGDGRAPPPLYLLTSRSTSRQLTTALFSKVSEEDVNA